MADAAQAGPMRGKLAIRGIGLLLTGDHKAPIAHADAIIAIDGRIVAAGPASMLDLGGADLAIDANGCAVCPGLIDTHAHPVFGDWTPRQNQLGWIEMGVNGGVTSLVSAGEVHLPGRPRDPVGVKALAITAQRCFQAFRPAGAKVHAGAPVPESALTRDDYAEMAAAGIRHIGEIGLGSVKTAAEATQVVRWCRELGLVSMIHTGGPSIAGSSLIDRDVVLACQPDVVSHVNGGPTSLSASDVRLLCERAEGAIEIVHNGNPRTAVEALQACLAAERADRLIIGTDAPAGSGVQPLGILRMIVLLASLGGGDPATLIAMATGNAARHRRIPGGLIAPGQPADLVFLDAPEGSSGSDALGAIAAGDIPGIGLVMIDGIARTGRSRCTPPARRVPTLVAR